MESNHDYDKGIYTLEQENIKLKELLELAIGDDGLGFYGKDKLYFTRDIETDLNKTTAVLKEEYRKRNPDVSKPNMFKSKSYECSARIKVDQGKRARKTLKHIKQELGEPHQSIPPDILANSINERAHVEKRSDSTYKCKMINTLTYGDE